MYKERNIFFFQNSFFLDKWHCFEADAKCKFVELDDMCEKLDTMFEDMSEYFCFDMKKYNMNQFFVDIKKFQDNYKVYSFIFNNFCFYQDNKKNLSTSKFKKRCQGYLYLKKKG